MDMTKWFLKYKASYLYTVFWVMSYESKLMDVLDVWQIPIFDKGYEKDPAMVAKEAIREALRSKQDVLLVDTAGCMQVQLHTKLF